MEALKTFDIDELLKRQEILDEKFDQKDTLRKRTTDRVLIAYYAELGELISELKHEWNYWKNSTKHFDKERVLEELSDCLHFYLSYFNRFNFWKIGNRNVSEYKEEIENFETAIISLTDINNVPAYKIFGAILVIAEYVGATENEFLRIHHNKWLKNMNERTREEY